MKIKCIENRVSFLPDVIKENYSISYQEFAIKIDKFYIVYAMTVFLGYVWYYLCDEDYSYYPVWSPSSLFQVTDSRLSRYWIYSYKAGIKAPLRPRWSFPEWANNPDYYDKLTDGDDEEVKIFRFYKELMDLEFPDPSISEIAQIGDSEWLICPNCMEAWISKKNIDALVRCPKCQLALNNPRFKSKWPYFEQDSIIT